MNIIANDCTGGFIYRDILKMEYSNPFIFSKVLLDDFIYLVNNYKTINFRKFKLCQSSEWRFYIRVDDSINIQYNHYRFDPTINGIKKDPPNVYSNHIWEYVVSKYINRLDRMVDPPIFIGHYDYGQLGEWDSTLTIEKVNRFVKCLQELEQPAIIISELPILANDTKFVKILRFKRMKLADDRYVPVMDMVGNDIYRLLNNLT